MSEEFFGETLRRLIRRQPFVPFEIDLIDGRRIVVDQPSLAFSGGAAGFLSDDNFVPFRCEEVLSIREVSAEATP